MVNLFNNIKKKKLINNLYHKLHILNHIKILNYLTINNVHKYVIKKKFYNLKNFYKSSNYLNITYKELKNINKRLKSGILLLSSPIGIITHKKALLYKTGGILLYYIN